MKLAELIETQRKALSTLEARIAARPSRDIADRLRKETLEDRVGRVEQRIARLQHQRRTTIARIDEAIANEEAALAAIRRMAATAPHSQPVKAAPVKVKAKARASAGKTKPAAGKP